MLTIEPTEVNKFWVCNPISFKHMNFPCAFFNSHLTTHHSNKDVRFSDQIFPLTSFLEYDRWSWHSLTALLYTFRNIDNDCVHVPPDLHLQGVVHEIMRRRPISIRPLCWAGKVDMLPIISTLKFVRGCLYLLMGQSVNGCTLSSFHTSWWTSSVSYWVFFDRKDILAWFLTLLSQVISFDRKAFKFLLLNHSQPLAEPS